VISLWLRGRLLSNALNILKNLLLRYPITLKVEVDVGTSGDVDIQGENCLVLFNWCLKLTILKKKTGTLSKWR